MLSTILPSDARCTGGATVETGFRASAVQRSYTCSVPDAGTRSRFDAFQFPTSAGAQAYALWLLGDHNVGVSGSCDSGAPTSTIAACSDPWSSRSLPIRAGQVYYEYVDTPQNEHLIWVAPTYHAVFTGTFGAYPYPQPATTVWFDLRVKGD